MGMLARKRSERFRDRQREIKSSCRNGRPSFGCGKSCYPSKSEAKSAVRRVIGNGSMTEKELMNHYWCDRCQSYHIGHNRPAGWRTANADLP